jgi:hypothetical protein
MIDRVVISYTCAASSLLLCNALCFMYNTQDSWQPFMCTRAGVGIYIQCPPETKSGTHSQRESRRRGQQPVTACVCRLYVTARVCCLYVTACVCRLYVTACVCCLKPVYAACMLQPAYMLLEAAKLAPLSTPQRTPAQALRHPTYFCSTTCGREWQQRA